MERTKIEALCLGTCQNSGWYSISHLLHLLSDWSNGQISSTVFLELAGPAMPEPPAVRYQTCALIGRSYGDFPMFCVVLYSTAIGD